MSSHLKAMKFTLTSWPRLNWNHRLGCLILKIAYLVNWYGTWRLRKKKCLWSVLRIPGSFLRKYHFLSERCQFRLLFRKSWKSSGVSALAFSLNESNIFTCCFRGVRFSNFQLWISDFRSKVILLRLLQNRVILWFNHLSDLRPWSLNPSDDVYIVLIYLIMSFYSLLHSTNLKLSLKSIVVFVYCCVPWVCSYLKETWQKFKVSDF